MPTVTWTLPDGSVLSLTTDMPLGALPALPTYATLSVAPGSVTSTNPADITAGSSSPSTPVSPTASDVSTPTQADVQAALAKVPPRWTATVIRAGKTFVATILATFAVYGGDIGAVIRDPKAFLVALGSALLMAIQKWVAWRE